MKSIFSLLLVLGVFLSANAMDSNPVDDIGVSQICIKVLGKRVVCIEVTTTELKAGSRLDITGRIDEKTNTLFLDGWPAKFQNAKFEMLAEHLLEGKKGEKSWIIIQSAFEVKDGLATVPIRHK